MNMLAEIRDQPAVVARMLQRAGSSLDELGSCLPGDITHAVVAARGTSDNAARYAQYVWSACSGLTVGLATPSLYGIYERPPSLEGALVVGISQSGQSPDLVDVLSRARAQSRLTIAITNRPDSPLGQIADLVMDLAAGEENAVAATKTYTAQLVTVALVSTALSGSDASALDGLPTLLGQVLDAEPEIVASCSGLIDANRCVVVGRGFHLATAHEWALKLQETTYMLAQPYSAADFLHGPSAAVDSGVPALLVASAGPAFDSVNHVASMLEERGCHMIGISDVPGIPADSLVMIPKTDHEWLSPIVAAPALQLFSYYLSRARGRDPDHPRGLRKVTKTR